MLLSFPRCAREENGGSVDADAALRIELSPAASVEWRTCCLKCGHEYTSFDGSDVIGLTRDELHRRFPEWDIVVFTREKAVLERKAECWCPDHYLLFLTDRTLTVSSAAEPDLVILPIIELDKEEYLFDDEAERALREGLAFDTLRELDGFLDPFLRKNTAERTD
ncbi:MAG: hypothetical protein J5586_02495 [Clostridia bacterium]|nr:hypothetical protein [Clostridia bacterium]